MAPGETNYQVQTNYPTHKEGLQMLSHGGQW